MTEHPITPSPELIEQWKAGVSTGVFDGYRFSQRETDLCIKAARWGADQELKACCEWVKGHWIDEDLRKQRRPKPPSLREQALQAAQRFYANGHEDCNDEEVKDDFDIIRRALEALPDV